MKNFIRFATLACAAFITVAAHAQVVVVANAKSTATALTLDQAASLYLGKTSQLPGAGPAVLLDQADASAVREQFYAKLTGKSAAQVKALWSRLVFSGKAAAPSEIADSAEVKRLLAGNPDAIGYLDKSDVDSSVKVLLSLD